MHSFEPINARAVAALVPGAVLSGQSDHQLSNAAPLSDAGENSISFIRTDDLALIKQRIGLLVAPEDLSIEAIPENLRPHALLCHPHPEAAWAGILAALFPAAPVVEEGVSPAANVSRDAVLGEGAAVAPGAVIAAGVRVGAGTQIGPCSTIGSGAIIGDDCIIHAGVNIYPEVRIGNRCIIHAGTVLGSDGYGYTTDESGIVKVPQIGGLLIGNDVEIGACCAIDRGAIGDTVIEDTVKIDNLVHIAHNVRIGAGTMVTAQVGFAGSVKIGKAVQIGGQAGLAGHLTVGDGAKISAQAGVIGDVPPESEVTGFPARPRKEFMRMMAWLARAVRKNPKDNNNSEL